VCVRVGGGRGEVMGGVMGGRYPFGGLEKRGVRTVRHAVGKPGAARMERTQSEHDNARRARQCCAQARAMQPRTPCTVQNL